MSDDDLATVNVAHFVAKQLGIPLMLALEIPEEALMAMSRYIYGRERDRTTAIASMTDSLETLLHPSQTENR